MDWTERKRQEAVVRLDKMLPAMQAAIRVGLNPTGRFEDLPFGFQSTLSDDLNTSGALTILDGAAERLVSVSTGDTIGSLEVAAREFVEGLNVLGLYDLLIKRTARRVGASEQLDGIHLRFVTILERARQTKDFSSVDALRTGLLAAGVEVRMSKAEVALCLLYTSPSPRD